MSEVPPGCGPHRKAASFWLSLMLSTEQMFLHVKSDSKNSQDRVQLHPGCFAAHLFHSQNRISITVSCSALVYSVFVFRLGS